MPHNSDTHSLIQSVLAEHFADSHHMVTELGNGALRLERLDDDGVVVAWLSKISLPKFLEAALSLVPEEQIQVSRIGDVQTVTSEDLRHPDRLTAAQIGNVALARIDTDDITIVWEREGDLSDIAVMASDWDEAETALRPFLPAGAVRAVRDRVRETSQAQ